MTERSTDHEYLQQVPRPVVAMAKGYPAGYEGYVHTHERAQFLYAASGTMKVSSDLGCWIIPPQRAVAAASLCAPDKRDQRGQDEHPLYSRRCVSGGVAAPSVHARGIDSSAGVDSAIDGTAFGV